MDIKSGITNSVISYFLNMDKTEMMVDFVVPNKMECILKSIIKKNDSKIFELPMRNSKPFVYAKNLKEIINKEKYDIVHAHGNSCTLSIEMYCAKIAGAKIRIAHSRNTNCKYKIIHKALRPVFNYLYTHGFACSHEAGEWLFGKRKYNIINNAKNIEEYKYNSTLRREYRNKYKINNKIAIGHVGFFNYQKNHDFLIDILFELVKVDNNYILIAIGDGSLKHEIEEKVNKMGLNDHVIFTGQSMEVGKILQAMDIMVLPSRFEGLPNVVIEWQIACLPCIVSSRVTEEVKITDLVKFLPLEAGPKIWAETISKIELTDRGKISDCIISQITDAGFDIEESAIKLQQIYQNMIGSL